MLTKLTLRNFKLFGEVEIDLGPRVVLTGPNNTGKTSALQALALWEIGVKRWLEKRGEGDAKGKKRRGVVINRRDLIAVPVPTARLLWRDLHVRKSRKENGKSNPENILLEVVVEGTGWTCGLEFDYANAESFHCRPLRQDSGDYMPVPKEAGEVQLAYLPPMSGLAANETRLDRGAINVRLGEGRTAEVLRNLCYQIVSSGKNGAVKWRRIVEQMKTLFGGELDSPEYIHERGEITLSYRTPERVRLDLSSSGRGQQQTLLLLAHMTANPGAVLLLDEPDAHLEILRQRQIYRLLSKTAEQTNSQIIAASHSEVVLNEAAGCDVVIAFVGKPHRIDVHGKTQALKSLKQIGFEHYLSAEEKGWVLYLEGATDLAILQTLARQLDHPAAALLERPYVDYVNNQPRQAQNYFHALREAKPDLVGIAIYDRLEQKLPQDPYLTQLMWRQCEIENYLCQRETLLAFAEKESKYEVGDLFASDWRQAMEASINEVEKALETLREPSPWGADIKASTKFLDKVFELFYEKVKLPQLTTKTNYHVLADHLRPEDIDPEITEKLDAIVEVASRASSTDE